MKLEHLSSENDISKCANVVCHWSRLSLWNDWC